MLKNGRVSAQSLGLACITAAVDLAPSVLLSLDLLIPFTTAGDPKLRNRAVKVSKLCCIETLRLKGLAEST